MCFRQSGKGISGVEVACEAKFPNGGLSILELIYIFPCFAAMKIGKGKCLSSEAADIVYQRCMAFLFCCEFSTIFAKLQVGSYIKLDHSKH